MRNAYETRVALLESKPDMFELLLLAGLIFSIPTNLFKTFLVETAYVSGLQIDYLIPKFHFSDIFLIAIFSILVSKSKNREKIARKISATPNKPILCVLAILLLLFQTTTQHASISFLFIFRIMILAATMLMLSNNTHILKSKVTTTAIKITLVFQSLLAWYQYLNQSSLFNYYFLGETNLNAYAGIAQSSLFGIQKILPYGTTAHPNVLAGILTIFSVYLANNLSKNSKIKHTEHLLLLLSTSVIILSQSVSAMIGFVSGLAFIYLNKKKKIHINIRNSIQLFFILNIVTICILFVVSNQNMHNSTSFSRRNFLNGAALKMFQNNPIAGVGLQNFTTKLEECSTNSEVVRFIQPVHNILLLVLSEIGSIGSIFIFLILLPTLKKNTQLHHPEYFFALLPILLLDHYLLTIQSGLILFAFSIVLIQNKTDNSTEAG